MASKQVKYGAVISYALIFLNATYGLLLTPYIIQMIGQTDYGVYKTISSLTSALMVLDLGLGGTMMRYIAKYRADKEEHKISNFVFMGTVQAGAVCVLIAVVTSVLYFFLDTIYQTGLSEPGQMEMAKQLYVFLAVGMIAHIIENLFNGVISGYNKFIFANGIKIARLLIRILLVIVFLQVYKNPLTLVLIDLLCTVGFVFIEFLYMRAVLKVKIRYTHWDMGVFLESFKYTMLLFLTSIVAQVNSNVANVVIGATPNGPDRVAIYSMALLIFGMYEQMSTAISGVMLPTVTNSLKNDDEKYTKTLGLVVGAGRIQFLLLGAVFVGFVTLGQPFVQLWLGEGYEDVYALTLILLGPALLELCVNVCLSILRAKNILGFRTAVITVSTAVNLLITLVGVHYWGYYAAAIGTAVSFLFGSVITMGIYYYKKLGINMLRIYSQIFNHIWICILLSGAAAFGGALLVSSPMLKFGIGFVAFVAVYAVTLLLFGLTKNEKQMIFKKLLRK